MSRMAHRIRIYAPCFFKKRMIVIVKKKKGNDTFIEEDWYQWYCSLILDYCSVVLQGIKEHILQLLKETVAGDFITFN